MSKYNIKRWDVIMFNNNNKVPIIYIKPDISLLEYLNNNQPVVSLEISDTNTIYDGKKLTGLVNRSCCLLNNNNYNCRPNYYEETGYYVITLVSGWYGYPNPDKLGIAIIKGLEKYIPSVYEEPKENIIEFPNNNNVIKPSDISVNKKYINPKHNNISFLIIILIIFGIIALLIFFILLIKL